MFLSAKPTYAFSVTFENTDFEDDFNGWTTVGDTSIQQNFESQLQYENKQAFISTGCPDMATGRCFDQQDTSDARNDDTTIFSGSESSGSNHFNFSGNAQINADGNGYTGSFSTLLLQDFLGVDRNSLHIPRENGTVTSGTRTPKEGSAIRQTITVDNEFTLSFNWSFLTNDITDPTWGDRDYGFVSIYDSTSNVGDRGIEVLADSSSVLGTSNTSFSTGTHTGGNGTGDYNTYTTTLPAGTYVVGLGVVDVDGDELTSGLFVDNFVIEEVPFDFSPTAGLLIVTSLLSFRHLRHKLNQEDEFHC